MLDHATSARCFVPDDLAAGAEVPASPAQAHHLGTVLRQGPGAAVRLFNGRDGEFLARIRAIRRDRAVFAVEARLRAQAAEPDLWLCFAPLKRDATDWVVEKATELGVSAVLPVITARTNAGRVNLERLRAIAVAAAEQSERLTVPRMADPQRLGELLGGWPAGRRLAVAIERAEAEPPRGGTGPGAALIGPEGGFAPEETDMLRRQGFVDAVSLGPRILRAETAAIVCLTLLQVPMRSYLSGNAGLPAR